jgi:hypothetical protein
MTNVSWESFSKLNYFRRHDSLDILAALLATLSQMINHYLIMKVIYQENGLAWDGVQNSDWTNRKDRSKKKPRAARWNIYLHIKISIWKYFWKAVALKMFVYFSVIWNLYGHFGIFYEQNVYFWVSWFIFPSFGMFYQEQSGNPDTVHRFGNG